MSRLTGVPPLESPPRLTKRRHVQAMIFAATGLLAAQVVIFVVLSDRSTHRNPEPEASQQPSTPPAAAVMPAQPPPAPAPLVTSLPTPPKPPTEETESSKSAPESEKSGKTEKTEKTERSEKSEPRSEPPARSASAGGKRRVEPRPPPPKSKPPDRKVAQTERERLEQQHLEQVRREDEQRVAAEQAERDRLERERAESQRLQLQIAQEKAEQERMERQRLQGQLERQRADQQRAERERNDPLMMVISLRSGVGSLSSSDIQAIYLGRSLYWPNGLPVHPFNRPASSGAGKKFYSDVLGMSSSRYREYWDSGPLGGSRPDAISDAEVLVGRIAATPGAVGYLLESELPSVDTRGVKVIRVR